MSIKAPSLPDLPATIRAWKRAANDERFQDSKALKLRVCVGLALRTLASRLPGDLRKQDLEQRSYQHFRKTGGTEILIDGKIRKVASVNRIAVANPSHVFAFEYSRPGLSTQEKLREQDLHARSVLENLGNSKAVQSCAGQVADHLERSVGYFAKDTFVYRLNRFLRNKEGEYPILPKRFHSFDQLLRFLKKEPDSVSLLSVLWLLFAGKNGSTTDREINYLYKRMITPQQDYVEDLPRKEIAKISAQVESARFGNSGIISDCDLFSSDKFTPYIRDVDYRKLNPEAIHPELADYLSGEKPYVSGASGMANMFCKVLNHLRIHPFSEEGRTLCETFSAFVVGSGMHSYEETYYSFNLYAKIRFIKADLPSKL